MLSEHTKPYHLDHIRGDWEPAVILVATSAADELTPHVLRDVMSRRGVALDLYLLGRAVASNEPFDVALASGFSSASHFARCYRSHFGETPRRMRG